MPSKKIERSSKYRIIGAPEVDDNPLLAHLDLPPATDSEAFLALALRPDFQIEDASLPAAIRRIRINRLRNFFVPTQPVHREALIGIGSQVFHGYTHRNPFTVEGQRRLLGGSIDQPYKPTISFIAGHSGMGKSTLVDRILVSLGQQVFHHNNFQGKAFPESQILWLRRNLPEHCTVKTLCSAFGEYTDQILGVPLYEGLFTSTRAANRDHLISQIRKIITNHHVGLLVFDEFQNLSLMGVGAEKIIALLVNLRDELGLPILIIGTYGSLHLLERSLSTARRLAEGGYYDLERPASADNDGWQQFCKIVWPYQWVHKPVAYNDSICEALYEVSQGIPGIMLSVFAKAQLLAIHSGTESVDADRIIRVFQDRMKPLHPAVAELRKSKSHTPNKFDGIYRSTVKDSAPDETSDTIPSETHSLPVETKPSTVKNRKSATSERQSDGLATSKVRAKVMNDCPSDISSAFKTT